MGVSQKQLKIEAAVAAYGCDLRKQWNVINDWGRVEGNYDTLDEVNEWIVQKERMHLGEGW